MQIPSVTASTAFTARSVPPKEQKMGIDQIVSWTDTRRAENVSYRLCGATGMADVTGW